MGRTSLTAKKRKKFLDLVRTLGNVTYAAAQIGYSRQRLYELRSHDAEFARDWDLAGEAGVEMLEQEARPRALSGVKDVEVHYDKDGKVNYRKVITKYSDTLLIFC